MLREAIGAKRANCHIGRVKYSVEVISHQKVIIVKPSCKGTDIIIDWAKTRTVEISTLTKSKDDYEIMI